MISLKEWEEKEAKKRILNKKNSYKKINKKETTLNKIKKTKEIIKEDDFLKKTYQLFVFSLIITIFVALFDKLILTNYLNNKPLIYSIFTINSISGLGMVSMIIELVLFASMFGFRKINIFNYFTFYIYSIAQGFILFPTIDTLYTNIYWQVLIAFILTAIFFFSLIVFSYTTKKDLSNLGNILGSIFVIIIVITIIMIIFPNTLNVPKSLVDITSVIFYCGFIVWYSQKITQGIAQTPIEGAIMLHIFFMNIFRFILDKIIDQQIYDSFIE